MKQVGLHNFILINGDGSGKCDIGVGYQHAMVYGRDSSKHRIPLKVGV